MKIACVGYREWALEIYDALAGNAQHEFLILRSKDEFSEDVILDFNPELVLFYGWSWIVPPTLIKKFKCIMLHPSPLPKYRGGSPLQNQIISGETKGAVTLFIMDEGLDTGPIVATQSISLEGDLGDIFKRITKSGISLTIKLLQEGLHPVPQNEAEATSFKRRKPEESEITLNEIREQTSDFLYNKIRMLQPPYPNAYIRTADGKKLLILNARIED